MNKSNLLSLHNLWQFLEGLKLCVHFLKLLAPLGDTSELKTNPEILIQD
jgi:hypothetical protein